MNKDEIKSQIEDILNSNNFAEVMLMNEKKCFF